MGEHPFRVGHRVSFQNGKSSEAKFARILWIGKLPPQNGRDLGILAGLECEDNVGQGNGMYKGIRYFQAKNDHAAFVPVSILKLAPNVEEEILPLRNNFGTSINGINGAAAADDYRSIPGGAGGGGGSIFGAIGKPVPPPPPPPPPPLPASPPYIPPIPPKASPSRQTSPAAAPLSQLSSAQQESRYSLNNMPQEQQQQQLQKQLQQQRRDYYRRTQLDETGEIIYVDEDGEELFVSDDDMDDILNVVANNYAHRIESITTAKKATTTTTTIKTTVHNGSEQPRIGAAPATTTTTTTTISAGAEPEGACAMPELEAGVALKESSDRWSKVASELKKAPTQVQEKLAVDKTTQLATKKKEKPPVYIEELAKANPKYKKTLCHFWKETGKCTHGDRCLFAHGEKELRPDVKPKYYPLKTVLCTYHMAAAGGCRNGDTCAFAHGEKELNTPRKTT